MNERVAQQTRATGYVAWRWRIYRNYLNGKWQVHGQVEVGWFLVHWDESWDSEEESR